MSESITNNYNSYHTFLILLEQAGVLPPKIKKNISRQTRYNFRKRDVSKIIGTELANGFKDELELFSEIFKSQNTIKVLKGAIKLI